VRSTFYKVTGRLSRQHKIALVADTHNTPCSGILEDLKTKNPDIIILAGYFSSPMAQSVQRLKAEGKTIKEIGAALRLKPAAVYTYSVFMPPEIKKTAGEQWLRARQKSDCS
jgi:hypothetical protein